MKIAIISDTHGNIANFRKAVDWLNKENIRTILHCGDIGSPESLKESLADFKGEFFGVFGNMDKDFKILVEEYNKILKVHPVKSVEGGVSPEAKQFNRVKINEDIFETEIDKKKIAITHFPEKAKKLVQSGKYDLVFYGHTHRPWDEKVPVLNGAEGGECHIINPGELAGQFFKPAFAVYDTSTGNIELKILERLD